MLILSTSHQRVFIEPNEQRETVKVEGRFQGKDDKNIVALEAEMQTHVPWLGCSVECQSCVLNETKATYECKL